MARFGGRPSREHFAVLLALGIHVVAILASPRRTGSGAPRLARTDKDELWELAAEPEPEPAPVIGPRAEQHSGPAGARGVSPAAATGGRAVAQAAGSPAALPSGPVVREPSGSWTFSPLRGQAPDLSLGDARYRVPLGGEHAPSEADTRPPRRALNPLQALDDRDVALGLGRGSAVVGAVEEVASQSDALGTALFDVTFDARGGVKVALLTSTEGASSWDAMRTHIAAAVATRPVRREEGHALKVRVQVEARVKLADGRDVRTLGTHAAATLGQVDPNSVAMREMPNLHVEHDGKVCVERLQIDPTGFGVGGGCSLENIGVAPRRIVAAREVSESRL